MASFDQGKADLLIQYSLLIAGDEDDFFDRKLGPIHLIKYVYLADYLYARRNNGETFTGSNWRFYNFGPWAEEVYFRLQPALNAIHANQEQFPSEYEENKDWYRWHLTDDHRQDQISQNIPAQITLHLAKFIHQFTKNTAELLDFVYKTEPMINAAPNEYLDFGTAVLENEDNKDVDFTPKLDSISKKKRKLFSERMQALREQQKAKKSSLPPLVNPSPHPRNDEIYHQGLEWLNNLEDNKLGESEMTVHFSDEVWKSKTRKGEDVS